MPTPNDDASDESTTTSTSAKVVGGMSSINAALPMVNQMVDPKRLVWLGGLVVVGALGVIEWPVVAAVGIGSYVAEQLAKDAMQSQKMAPR